MKVCENKQRTRGGSQLDVLVKNSTTISQTINATGQLLSEKDGSPIATDKNTLRIDPIIDQNKLSKTDVETARKGSSGLIKFLIEYLQRKRGLELERAKIRVKHGSKFGEVILCDTIAFIIHDIYAPDKRVDRAAIHNDGSLGP